MNVVMSLVYGMPRERIMFVCVNKLLTDGDEIKVMMAC